VVAAQERFDAAFKSAGITPDVAAALAWDPGMIIVDALRQLGPAASAAQLRDYISHLKNYAGINGVYDFTAIAQRGLDVGAAVVTLWDPEKKVWTPVSQPAGAPLEP
jgi:branched-chain amino acid transport system substrate-binding protein